MAPCFKKRVLVTPNNAHSRAFSHLVGGVFPVVESGIREICLAAGSEEPIAPPSIAHPHRIHRVSCHNRHVNLPTKRSSAMAVYLLISGLGSWFAAFTLSREGYLLAKSGITPSCDINPFFSCGNVMESWQATVLFNAPNQLYGVAGFMLVATVGAAMLAGATMRRWFWVAFTIGIFAAYAWLMWMFVQAVFVIGFLCLYCMVVWAIHIPMWWIFLPWALKHGLLGDARGLRHVGAAWLPYAWVPIVINYAVIGLGILIQFPLLFSV